MPGPWELRVPQQTIGRWLKLNHNQDTQPIMSSQGEVTQNGLSIRSVPGCPGPGVFGYFGRLSVRLSVRLPVRLPIQLSIQPSFRLSVQLGFRLTTCLKMRRRHRRRRHRRRRHRRRRHRRQGAKGFTIGY